MNRPKTLLACVAIACAGLSGTASAFQFGFARQDSADFQSTYAQPINAGADQNYDLGEQRPQTTRVVVADPTDQKPGVITIDTENRHLYLSLPGGQAMRYDVGVGREGFEWGGLTAIGRKAEWPGWTPPAAMLKRRPDLPRHMAGGVDNPLGARAMYLYSGARDTGFRIHGSNEPGTIGQAVSSGCIRMLNTDVEDLYNRVRVGTKVIVLR